MSTHPQRSWSLRIDNVNPSGTALIPHHQSRCVHKLVTHPETSLPRLTRTLKKSFLKPIRGVWVFWALAALDSLSGAHNRCGSFLQHSPVSEDWLCCERESGPKFGSVTHPFSHPPSFLPSFKPHSFLASIQAPTHIPDPPFPHPSNYPSILLSSIHPSIHPSIHLSIPPCLHYLLALWPQISHLTFLCLREMGINIVYTSMDTG